MPNDAYSSARRRHSHNTFRSFFFEGSSKEMVVQLGCRLCYHVGGFRQGLLEEILPDLQNYAVQKEPHAVQTRIQRAFLEIL